MSFYIQMASRLLTVYFIAQPLLFGIHSFDHHHDCHEDSRHELVYSLTTTNCELCDLYHTQTAAIETSDNYVDLFSFIFIELPFTESLCESPRKLTFLRGPPIA
jgi:hypothetical protein